MEGHLAALAGIEAADRLGDLGRFAEDPLGLQRFLWPAVEFYDRQVEMIRAVVDCDEVVVSAGNMLGKDFAAGFVCLWAFLCHPEARVVTTSVKDDHLRVLWGEIGRFVQSSKEPLIRQAGGPLILNHRDVRKLVNGVECKISYLRGMVSERGEGMAGHHAAYTLLVVDEASGVDDEVQTQGEKWARRKLIFGNPRPCENFFRRAVKAGDLSDGGRLVRKVMKVRAEDSPNVKRALSQIARGEVPDNREVTPGVLRYEDGAKGYVYRRKHWNAVEQTIGLDAEFYEGAEVLMFPPAWLAHAGRLADALAGKPRQAAAVGVDPGEGGADTSLAAVDRLGLIDLQSVKTPDTNVIPGMVLAFARRHGVPAERIVFDRGGGGKHHADRLRARGHDVRTVAFGESVQPNPRRGRKGTSQRVEEREERTAYVNRRAQMYGELREALDPSGENGGFAIPSRYSELRRQLTPIPLTYDGEGRLYLLPKNKKDAGSKVRTLTELIGRSPDDADALVLALHCVLHPERRAVAGAMKWGDS